MSFDPIGAAIGLLPLVGEQLKAFRDRDEVKSLFTLVENDVGRAAELPREVRPIVLEKLAEIRQDGYVLAAIQRYLEHSDIEAIPALRERLQRLIVLGDRQRVPVLRLIPTSRHASLLLTPWAISCPYRCCFSAWNSARRRPPPVSHRNPQDHVGVATST